MEDTLIKGELFIDKLDFFQSYNGITKKYIVMAVTVQDLLNDPRYKDNKCLLLLANPNANVKKHNTNKKRQKSTRDLVSSLQKSILNLQKEVKSNKEILLDFINQQTKFNKFVMNQFKQHGWIK